jgi:hypothetical protein
LQISFRIVHIRSAVNPRIDGVINKAWQC